MNKKVKINKYLYFLVIFVTGLLIETAICWILPALVTFCGDRNPGEADQMADFFMKFTFLKTVYIGLPVSVLGILFLKTRGESRYLCKLNPACIYTLISLVAFIILSQVIIQDYDFLEIHAYAPDAGCFYYCLINGFIAFTLAEKLVKIWCDNPLSHRY